ncbi:unnamed protein product [Brassicogethes aeneus]|uniref:Uncharacterized protein n=1 Tax=Brassicogethes aeneus TaxID=1431903 RepID=A0A9P0B7A0_BRAAE|nr:unnamed protein product [Brassicogethes aeneus]
MDTVIFLIIIAACYTKILSAPLSSNPRLSLADWNNYNLHEPNGPGTYAFGFDIEDPDTGNAQFRNEEKHANGSVTGSYGYMDPDGVARITHYIADAGGYRSFHEESPINLLKPIFTRPISEISHLSEKPDAPSENFADTDHYDPSLDNIEFISKIVTPDVPFGSINQNYLGYQNFGNNFQYQGSNQLQSGFDNNYNYPVTQRPFVQNQNVYVPPQITTTTEPIWPNFSLLSLFGNRVRQTPKRTFIKLH